MPNNIPIRLYYYEGELLGCKYCTLEGVVFYCRGSCHTGENDSSPSPGT